MRMHNGLAHARVWHLVDARGKVLGRLAQRISIALRGKYKPSFNPSVDSGDYVVVINAKDVHVTGNKYTQKEYFSHSGYPGGEKIVTFDKLIEKHPTEPIRKAVSGMLPKNSFRKICMDRLKIFAGNEHPYEANIMKSYLPTHSAGQSVAVNQNDSANASANIKL